MTDMVSKVDRVSATEISELIDSMRHRPVATTAAQMRLAADALEITERAYQGVLTDNRDLATEIERLTKALRITELKASGTLANNLCPDHRDKQTGKPCLACEIERLRNGFSHSIRIAKEQHSEIERLRAGLEMIAGDRYEQQYQRAPSLAEAQRIARAALAGSSVETTHHLTQPERDALNRALDRSVTEVHPGIPPGAMPVMHMGADDQPHEGRRADCVVCCGPEERQRLADGKSEQESPEEVDRGCP